MQELILSQGTAPVEPSVIFRKILRYCSTCKKEFEQNTPFNRDGSETVPLRSFECVSCSKERQHLEQIDKAKIRLAEIIEAERDRWFEQYGLKGKWQNVAFEANPVFEEVKGFNRALAPKAFDTLKAFDPDQGKSLILRSDNYGVGKTHLVAALINQLVESKPPASFDSPNTYHIRRHPCPALFTTEPQMLARLRRTFSRDSEGETEEQVYTVLRKTPLLVIDDVGKVQPKDLSFLQGVYFNVIDARYTDEMPIILTTNLTLSELESHLGGASADRLREMCGKQGIITITAKSYRR